MTSVGPRSLPALTALVLLLCPLAQGQAQPAEVGQWSGLMAWPSNGTHTILLPTGKVLTWEEYTPSELHLWDPATGGVTVAAHPGFNVFCAGHAFMSDGRLLVAGGHLDANLGLPNASIYDPFSNSWTRLPDMNAGRWYPTNTNLANGEVLVIAGTATARDVGENRLPQVWQPTSRTWRNLTSAQRTLRTYPWMFVAPNGQVFMAGPDPVAGYLDTSGTGAWNLFARSDFGDRFSGSAVMYDEGKVMVSGGGESMPTDTVEVIDINSPTPAFRRVQSMHQRRKQHNATLLPDGTVLLTDGSSGPGKSDELSPVLTPELWDPTTETFTQMAPAAQFRGYHSSALLLPDGRVLTTGGELTHNAQLYSPPYLFKGPRPNIRSTPDAVKYGETFRVETPQAASIARVTWLALGAATHAFNQGQRINRLAFTRESDGLRVTAPSSSKLATAGYYMLFLLDGQGVPSVARMVKLGGPDATPPAEVKGVSLGEAWKYHEGEEDPGPTWFSASFEDSRWKTGRGGFGTRGDGTVLQVEDDQPTVYFRKKFVMHGAAMEARLQVHHDDGVAVWVNGTAVLVLGMDRGTEHDTYASGAVPEGTVSDVPVPPGALLEGENVIAVMVKRVKPTRSDSDIPLHFDLELSVRTRGQVDPVPVLSLTAPNGGETLQAGSSYQVAGETEGALAQVRLEWSADGGVSWQAIGTAAGSTGRYTWQVPELDSSQVLVRVLGSGVPASADASDAPFTVRGGGMCTSEDCTHLEPPGGCGCGAGSVAPSALGLFLALGWVLRGRKVSPV